MPHTETYYVSVTDNKVKPITDNISSYFQPIYDKKNYGKAKYCIEVFATSNHKNNAKKVRDMIDKEGLSDNIFSIKIDMK
jgi:hypothetical protein